MNRYRSYGAADDQPATVGDPGFLGVDEYNAPENIRPGEVQKAVNLDFSSQDAQTRGGFVQLPGLNSVPSEYASKWNSAIAPVNKSWESVAYGNGRFIAVQSDGTGVDDLMYSSDGNSWFSASSGLTIAWSAITFGNGVFVAVGEGTQQLNLVTGTGDTLVTSSGDSLVAEQFYQIGYSYDGLSWYTTPSQVGHAWESVTYGNNLFVAVANGVGGSSQVMTSPNGINWTIRSTPVSLANHNWRSVVYGSDRFVAVASGGSGTLNRAMYSLDGVTWVAATTPSDPAGCVSVSYGGGVFVAVASTSSSGTLAVMTSSDGITWTARTTPTDSWTSIAYGNATFIAVGDSGVASSSVMISTDGLTWVTRTAADTNAWASIAYGANLFVVVSTDGYPDQVMVTSPVKSVYGTGLYSDPEAPTNIWIMLVGATGVGFYASGKSPRTISYGGGQLVSESSTIVQANNQVYLFRGSTFTPLYWDGDWNSSFELVPDTTLPASFDSIPPSNQATYYQNRLWVIDGKDEVAASDILSFTDYDPLANEFNLSVGNSDYLVEVFPFGQNSIVAFKNKSIMLLQNVEGSLSDVTVTEVTRQVGLVGINAVCSIGPDLAYVSYGNINLLTLTSTNNSLQHKTLPLSTKIRAIMARVNWSASSKISIGYWSNKLYVALPLDNSSVCNAVAVYNFTTQNWYGEWSFDPSVAMSIQSWQVVDYLGLQRLHAITEDGRIFVTDEGQSDISGGVASDISTELVTRAFDTNNLNHFQRRIYLDLATNRASFSAYAYSEGANEESTLLTNQTYSRSQSWKFNDSTYDLTNANNDYNRAYRKDYSTGPDNVQCGTGFLPEMAQEFRLPLVTRRQGRLSWIKVTNSQGFISVMSLGLETRPGQRANLTQV